MQETTQANGGLTDDRLERVREGIRIQQELEHDREMLKRRLDDTLQRCASLQAELGAMQVAHARAMGEIESYRRERGATILLASHNMNEVERLCDRVIMLKRGRIEDDDTPAGLIARYGRSNLEEVFLDIARGTGEAREAAQ